MERVAVARRVWREWLEVTRHTRRVQRDTARRVTVTLGRDGARILVFFRRGCERTRIGWKKQAQNAFYFMHRRR